MRVLKQGVFDRLESLEKVAISCNPLEKLPSRLFHHNPHIKEFNLIGCFKDGSLNPKLTLTDLMFDSVTLLHIHIQNVHIDTISKDWLKNCSGIQKDKIDNFHFEKFDMNLDVLRIQSSIQFFYVTLSKVNLNNLSSENFFRDTFSMFQVCNL